MPVNFPIIRNNLEKKYIKSHRDNSLYFCADPDPEVFFPVRLYQTLPTLQSTLASLYPFYRLVLGFPKAQGRDLTEMKFH